jgi:hypothetical protein
MKRIIALLLSIVMLFTGCVQAQQQSQLTNTEENSTAAESTTEPIVWEDVEPQFNSLDDELLLAYIEDLVYMDTVSSINSEKYFVENVSAVYISKEYLEEVAFNSQSNIYFGYTLAELDELFKGAKYIFTLSESGTTTVQELQEIEDVSTEVMLKNVAVGTGVILVCVTVSVVSAQVGAPAVSMIFAASATTAKTFAISGSKFGAISAGIVTGIQTGDFDEALKAAALAGSEGFKWGAITGGIVGGSVEAFLLKAATRGGLTMNEAAIIQRDSILPIDVIKEIRNFDEYLVYKEAGLKPLMVKGKIALLQNIDLNYVSQLPDGTEVTNLIRMQKGYAPIDPVTGKAYQLHHIGQKADGTLAVLTQSQHQGNSAILNMFGKESEIIRSEFATTRKEFWEYLGKSVYANGGIIL